MAEEQEDLQSQEKLSDVRVWTCYTSLWPLLFTAWINFAQGI